MVENDSVCISVLLIIRQLLKLITQEYSSDQQTFAFDSQYTIRINSLKTIILIIIIREGIMDL